MLSYYVIYYEKLKNVMQQTEKVALNIHDHGGRGGGGFNKLSVGCPIRDEEKDPIGSKKKHYRSIESS